MSLPFRGLRPDVALGMRFSGPAMSWAQHKGEGLWTPRGLIPLLSPNRDVVDHAAEARAQQFKRDAHAWEILRLIF